MEVKNLEKKMVLEQVEWMSDKKIIKFDIDNIYAYKLSDI